MEKDPCILLHFKCFLLLVYIDLISPGPGTVVLSAQIAKKESLAQQLLVATIIEFTAF